MFNAYGRGKGNNTRAVLLGALFMAGTSALGTGVAGATFLQQQSLSAYPAAVCNDGAPAAYYHSGSPSSNWLIFLDGGGGCVTQQECDDRWGRTPGDMVGGAQLPAQVNKHGIFTRGQAINPVRDWNLVYIHYCSSDEWIGGGGTLASGATAQGLGAPASYVFRGADIFDATIHHLMTVGIPDGNGGQSQLSDTASSTVVLAGTSAGGKGVMNNVLRLEARLPQIQKYYVVDAYFHGLDNGLALSDDAPEFPQKTVYAPKLSTQCSTLDCLQPATVHAQFQTLGLKVFYGFAEEDAAIGGEGPGSCAGLAYPYTSTCTGGAGPGSAAQKAQVITAAVPADQYAGWHPSATQHVLITQDSWFYGTAVGALINNVSYAQALSDMLAGSPGLHVAP